MPEGSNNDLAKMVNDMHTALFVSNDLSGTRSIMEVLRNLQVESTDCREWQARFDSDKEDGRKELKKWFFGIISTVAAAGVLGAATMVWNSKMTDTKVKEAIQQAAVTHGQP